MVNHPHGNVKKNTKPSTQLLPNSTFIITSFEIFAVYVQYVLRLTFFYIMYKEQHFTFSTHNNVCGQNALSYRCLQNILLLIYIVLQYYSYRTICCWGRAWFGFEALKQDIVIRTNSLTISKQKRNEPFSNFDLQRRYMHLYNYFVLYKH